MALCCATALLVTHDQSEALSMGHQVAVLWDGQRVQVASPEQLYRMTEPASTSTTAPQWVPPTPVLGVAKP